MTENIQYFYVIKTVKSSTHWISHKAIKGIILLAYVRLIIINILVEKKHNRNKVLCNICSQVGHFKISICDIQRFTLFLSLLLKYIYIDFQSSEFAHTWWKLFQKCAVLTHFDMFVFITIVRSIPLLLLLPECIIRPVVSVSIQTWFIRYIYN